MLPGRVIKVVDGDTVHVLDAKKVKHNIRMAGIDAPERGQPYSKAATKFLKKMVAGKNVCVEWYKKDRYKRLVGVVFYDNKDINYEMVKNGYAWHFKKYQNEQTPADRILYDKAETNSRLSVIGLWQEPEPITPDDWRSGVRPAKKSEKKAIPTATTQAQTISLSCSGKRFCKHMSSCAEACHYLKQCGISRLDRDKDGIPCESICNSGC
ncbi:nuclease [Leucothrix sargassi]|nr:nuclease [Leucothrix sargassi]